MGRLAGKRAVITGAAGGIGRAAALLFAREGARVLCVDKAEAAGETARELGEAGLFAVGDVADEVFVRRAMDRAQAELGGLDVCWANAGINNGRTPIVELTAEAWSEVMRVNLLGAFLAVKHAAPLIAAAGGGSIILTSSAAGLRAGASGAAYSASKAGVISLAQKAANELAPQQVRVNAIAPGVIETGMTRALFDNPQTRARIGENNPLGRGGSAEEIALAGLYLASDESAYVTGAVIPVDGGLSSSLPR